MSLGFWNAWRVKAYVLDKLHLLLTLIFPSHNIVIGLPILQSLEHRLIGDQYPTDLLISRTSVQWLIDHILRYVSVRLVIRKHILLLSSVEKSGTVTSFLGWSVDTVNWRVSVCECIGACLMLLILIIILLFTIPSFLAPASRISGKLVQSLVLSFRNGYPPWLQPVWLYPRLSLRLSHLKVHRILVLEDIWLFISIHIDRIINRRPLWCSHDLILLWLEAICWHLVDVWLDQCSALVLDLLQLWIALKQRHWVLSMLCALLCRDMLLLHVLFWCSCGSCSSSSWPTTKVWARVVGVYGFQTTSWMV